MRVLSTVNVAVFDHMLRAGLVDSMCCCLQPYFVRVLSTSYVIYCCNDVIILQHTKEERGASIHQSLTSFSRSAAIITIVIHDFDSKGWGNCSQVCTFLDVCT